MYQSDYYIEIWNSCSDFFDGGREGSKKVSPCPLYGFMVYKKTTDYCKLEEMFQKKAISGSHIREIADKNTTYNEGRLYVRLLVGVMGSKYEIVYIL